MGIGQRWSGAHTRGETSGIQRELGSERVDSLRYIRLIVAQMSSMQPPVCAESWGLYSSFLRGSWKTEFLVPPEQLVMPLTVVSQGTYLPCGPLICNIGRGYYQYGTCAHYHSIYCLCLVCRRGQHAKWTGMAIQQQKIVVVWEVSRNSERAQSMADLWLTGDETEQSFVKGQSTEPSYPVFGCGCLLLPSLYFRDNLVHGVTPLENFLRKCSMG